MSKNDFFATGSICLSDIPKELMKKHENGKIYLNIAIRALKEKDTNDNTHHVIASTPKKEWVEGGSPNYIGRVKQWVQNPESSVRPEHIDELPAVSENDLPF